MLKSLQVLCFFSFVLSNAQIISGREEVHISEDLKLIKINENTFIHSSYLTLKSYGRFICNGLITLDGKKAIIIDTPPTSELTKLFLDWLLKKNIQIQAIIVNHFHSDCLAGLDQFHSLGIPSYGFKLTKDLAIKDGAIPPENIFKKTKVFCLGEERLIATYLGEAHSKDNIVVWLKNQKILFGGCMVKSLKAGKGNIADANLKEWPKTIQKVKANFGTAKVIIPGHGKFGGIDLLEYTIELFSEKGVLLKTH